jgi:hypothetical protein
MAIVTRRKVAKFLFVGQPSKQSIIASLRQHRTYGASVFSVGKLSRLVNDHFGIGRIKM